MCSTHHKIAPWQSAFHCCPTVFYLEEEEGGCWWVTTPQLLPLKYVRVCFHISFNFIYSSEVFWCPERRVTLRLELHWQRTHEVVKLHTFSEQRAATLTVNSTLSSLLPTPPPGEPPSPCAARSQNNLGCWKAGRLILSRQCNNTCT